MVNHQRHKKSTYHPTESLSLLICFSRGSDDFEYVNFCDPWEQLHRRKDPVTDLPQYPQSDPEPYCPPQSLRRTNKITQGPSMNITLDITPIHPQVHIILSPRRSSKHRYKATHCLSMEIIAFPPTLTSNLNLSRVRPTRSILSRHRRLSMHKIASLLPLPAT